MASSILPVLVMAVCGATIVQASPIAHPASYYYLNPGSYYGYGGYGPSYPAYAPAYPQYTMATAAPTPAPTPPTFPTLPTAAPLPTGPPAPGLALPGGLDLQRITDFFQSLFPFLRPTPTAPATGAFMKAAANALYGGHHGYQVPNIFQFQQEPGAVAPQQFMAPVYSFGYPYMSANPDRPKAK